VNSILLASLLPRLNTADDRKTKEFFTKAVCAEREGNFCEAERMYMNALKESSDYERRSMDLYFRLAKVLEKEGKSEEAQKYFEKQLDK